MFLVDGIKRGVIAFITASILAGVCLVFGFSPEEWIAAIVTEPPQWLLHPLTRVGVLAVGGLLGVLAWKLWPWRSPGTSRNLDQRFPTVDPDQWRGTDPLLLWHAGCLWNGIKPRYPVEFDNPAYAAFSMLLRAAEHGEFELIKREPDPKFAFSQVTRHELAKYAAKKGDMPEFLNDIIPNLTEESEYIDLHEAAIRTYEETEETLVAYAAETSSLDRNRNVISWYAYALLGKNQQTPIYGRSPPSRIRRQIPPDEFKRCRFSDDARSLIRHSETEPKFVELEIKESDLLKRLEEIKTWSGE